MKVGICYNGDQRDNGTAFLARYALEHMAGVESVFVRSPSEIVPKCDFYLYVDDGRDDIAWLPPHPCAYWAIDTHLGYGYRAWKSQHFDRVFVAQKDAVAKLWSDNVDADWLPLACSPDHHPTRQELLERHIHSFRPPRLMFPPEALEQVHDFAFCGFLNDSSEEGFNNRVEYLDALFKDFPNSWLTTGVFHEDMAVRYLRARIGFNVSIRNDLNMRVFEVMSTGTPLLTNRNVEGVGDHFKEGEHFIGYEGIEDLRGRAREALEGPSNSERIGQQAHALVRANHTYKHRMQTIIDTMKEAA